MEPIRLHILALTILCSGFITSVAQEQDKKARVKYSITINGKTYEGDTVLNENIQLSTEWLENLDLDEALEDLQGDIQLSLRSLDRDLEHLNEEINASGLDNMLEELEGHMNNFRRWLNTEPNYNRNTERYSIQRAQNTMQPKSLYSSQRSYFVEDITQSDIQLLARADILLDEKLQMKEFSTFPNPNKGRFSLRFESSEEGDLRLRIVNLIGSTVMERNFPELEGEKNIAVDITNQPAGIYFIILQQNGKTTSRRISIQG